MKAQNLNEGVDLLRTQAKEHWQQKKYHDAYECYRQLADYNQTDAQLMLGLILANAVEGINFEEYEIKTDRKAAHQSWLKAADNPLETFWKEKAQAMQNLAENFRYGRGVGKSLEQSVYWYRKAIAHGYGKARGRLNDLCKKNPDLRESALEPIESIRPPSQQFDQLLQQACQQISLMQKMLEDDPERKNIALIPEIKKHLEEQQKNYDNGLKEQAQLLVRIKELEEQGGNNTDSIKDLEQELSRAVKGFQEKTQELLKRTPQAFQTYSQSQHILRPNPRNEAKSREPESKEVPKMDVQV